MKKCKHCQMMIDDRSIFCAHCGKSVEEPVVKKTAKAKPAEDEIVANNLPSMGLVLFFVGLIGFDFILPTLFDYLSLNTKIPFYISTVIYIAAAIVCVLSVFDYRRKLKSGLNVSSKPNSTAYAVMVMCVFLLVMNMTQVIMK